MAPSLARQRSPAGRIVRWILMLVAALALILALALVGIFSFEQYTLRPLAEHYVEKFTGRRLAIDGEIDARAGAIVRLHIEGVHLANADWGSREQMLSIERAEASVGLWQLLGGAAVIDNLVIDGAQILFEQDAQGQSNWALGPDDDPATRAVETSAAPTAAMGTGSGLTALPLSRSRLSDIGITIHAAALPNPVTIRLDSVEHRVDQDSDLTASIVGAVDERPLELQARLGPIAQLLNAGAVDFEVDADFVALDIDIDGQVDRLPAPAEVSLHLSLVSADISQIFIAYGLPVLLEGATELKASLLPAGAQHTLDLAARLDLLELDAQARLQSLYSIDGAALTLSANGGNLGALARLAGVDGLPSSAFELGANLALDGQRLDIGDTFFESGDNRLSASGSLNRFPRLEDTNLELRLAGKNYLDFARLLDLEQAEKLPPEPYEVIARLQYDAEDRQLFNATLTLADLRGDFSGELTAYPAFTGSRLDYRLGGQNDALLQRLLNRPVDIAGNYELQGDLLRTADGYRLESAALSLGDNRLQLSGTVGNAPLSANTELEMQFTGPDLDKLVALSGYDGFMPSGDADIEAAARVQDRQVRVESLSAQLGRNRLTASGSINLDTLLSGSRLQLEVAGADIAEVLPPEAQAYVDPGQSFELTGTLATRQEALDIGALQARLGEVNLQASGSLSLTRPLQAMALALQLDGPDLAALVPAQLVPFSLPAARFSLSGDVGFDPVGLTLDGIDASIGPDRLTVSGVIPLDDPADGLQLVLAARGPDLGKLVPPELAQVQLASQPYELELDLKLAEQILSVRQLELSTPRGKLAGDLSLSLLNPLQFGEFDLQSQGDNLSEFLPPLPNYRPAAVDFNFDARGSWDNEKISIDEGLLELASTRIEARGEVNMPPNSVATRLDLSARGAALSDIGQFEGFNLPADAFELEASIQGDAENLRVPRLKLRVGPSDLSGSLQVAFAERPDISVDLQSEVLSLEKFLAKDEEPAPVATPPPVEVSETNQPFEHSEPRAPKANNRRVIPDQTLPAEQLLLVNLNAKIVVNQLQLPNTTLTDIEIDASLQDGKLIVSHLDATAPQGDIIARFQAVAEGERIVTHGILEGKNFVLSEADAEDPEFSIPQQDMRLEFDTAGATLRELAANLNGQAQLTGGEGKLKNSYALGLYGNFFSELLSAVNPFVTREPYTPISCFGVYAEIIDGVATIEPGAVMQTDKLNMFAHGQVDLNTEIIGLRFDTSARSGIGISVSDFVNPFVGVSGTLADPGLGVDPKNALFEGGFAYMTGGLSIVATSLFNRWFGARDPCARLAQDAEKRQKAREAEKAKEKAQAEPASE